MNSRDKKLECLNNLKLTYICVKDLPQFEEKTSLSLSLTEMNDDRR